VWALGLLEGVASNLKVNVWALGLLEGVSWYVNFSPVYLHDCTVLLFHPSPFPLDVAQDAELAWHFFLPGLTSGYMYYGSAEDMPVKQTVAANVAVKHALKAITE